VSPKFPGELIDPGLVRGGKKFRLYLAAGDKALRVLHARLSQDCLPLGGLCTVESVVHVSGCVARRLCVGGCSCSRPRTCPGIPLMLSVIATQTQLPFT
jgi:hypothetical protein